MITASQIRITAGRLGIADYNPDPLLRTRGEGLDIYELMHADDKLAGIHEFKVKAIMSVDWEIKPGNDGAPAKKYAEEFKRNMDALGRLPDEEGNMYPLTFVGFLKNMFDAWRQGYKVAEKVWLLGPGNQWWYRAIKPKASKLINFKQDDYDNLLSEGVTVRNYNGLITVPIKKCVIRIHPYMKDGNMYGVSDYRSLYREWWSKDVMLKMAAKSAESYATPIRVVVYDKDKTSSAQYDDIKDSMDDLYNNLCLYIPGRRNKETGALEAIYDFTLKEAQRPGSDIFMKLIEYYDLAMSRRLLIGDKLGFSNSESGSYALGEVHFDLFMSVVQEEHKNTEDMVNVQVIPDWMVANYPTAKQEDWPKMKFMDLREGVTKEKADIVGLAVMRGMINPEEPWVRPYLKFPPIDPAYPLPQARIGAGALPKQFTDIHPIHTEHATFADIRRVAMARVDFKSIESTLDEGEEKSLSKLVKLFEESRVEFIARARKAHEAGVMTAGSITVKKDIQIRTGEIIETTLGSLYLEGRNEAAKEVRTAKKNLVMVYRPFLPEMGIGGVMGGFLTKYAADMAPQDRETLRRIKQIARTLGTDTWQGITHDVERIIISSLGKKSIEQIVGDIDYAMAPYLETGEIDGSEPEAYSLKRLIRTEGSRYFNEGRLNTMFDPDLDGFVQGMLYSAILDDRTTEYCARHDGHAKLSSDPLVKLIPPAHWNCRSLWAPIFRGEKFDTDWPANPKLAPGFGG